MSRRRRGEGWAALRREYRRLAEVELRSALEEGEDWEEALAEYYAAVREMEDLEEEEEDWAEEDLHAL